MADRSKREKQSERAAVRALYGKHLPTPAQEREAERAAKARERAVAAEAASYGRVYERVICPHCQTAGHVRIRELTVKDGISGGKATGALLTGGLSVLATGLSQKQTVARAHCGWCGVTWVI